MMFVFWLMSFPFGSFSMNPASRVVATSSVIRSIAFSRVHSPSASQVVAFGLRCMTFVMRSGFTASWKVAEPFGQRLPVEIGLSGLPSMFTISTSPFSSLCFVWISVPQPTAQYGQIDAVVLVPSSLRRATRSLANATSNPSPPSPAAATPAVPMPESFRNCRRVLVVPTSTSRNAARAARPMHTGMRCRGGYARSRQADDRFRLALSVVGWLCASAGLVDLTGEAKQRFPSVQLGIVEDPLEQLFDDPADLGSLRDTELLHEVGPVRLQVARREGVRPRDLLLDTEPELVEGVHPPTPGA